MLFKTGKPSSLSCCTTSRGNLACAWILIHHNAFNLQVCIMVILSFQHIFNQALQGAFRKDIAVKWNEHPIWQQLMPTR